MLAVATVVLAMRTGVPEVVISQTESEAIAGATVALLDHYGYAGVSETTQLWINLAVVTGGTAWNHYDAYMTRKDHEKRVARTV
jgi:hypothetical protein